MQDCRCDKRNDTITHCRFSWNNTGDKNVEGTDKDSKEGVTIMLTNDGTGAILPLVICVGGKTHVALDNFVSQSPDEWSAPGTRKGKARKLFMQQLLRENGCTDSTGALQ